VGRRGEMEMEMDHLEKILGLMLRGLKWRDNVGLYLLGILV
jgi:hypothetical protein